MTQVGVTDRRRRFGVLRDGTQVDLGADPGPSVGWSPEAPPDAAMLGNDFARLLDLGSMAGWLESVPGWSEWSADGGGVKRKAMAKALPTGPSWGAVKQIEVAMVLDAQATLASLTIVVLREPERPPRYRVEVSAMLADDYTRGDPARWASAFPLAPLLLPNDVLGPSLPEGHPDIGESAHETTTYVLRSASGPVSPELDAFLRARRVVR